MAGSLQSPSRKSPRKSTSMLVNTPIATTIKSARKESNEPAANAVNLLTRKPLRRRSDIKLHASWWDLARAGDSDQKNNHESSKVLACGRNHARQDIIARQKKLDASFDRFLRGGRLPEPPPPPPMPEISLPTCYSPCHFERRYGKRSYAWKRIDKTPVLKRLDPSFCGTSWHDGGAHSARERANVDARAACWAAPVRTRMYAEDVAASPRDAAAAE